MRGIATAAHLPRDTEWYRRTPSPVRKVIRGNTSVGSADDLARAEANRLRPTWSLSGLQTSKGESEPPPP